MSAAIAVAASITDEKQTKKIPALGAAHLKAAGDTITIASNNLDRALTLTVPAVVEAAGEVAVSAARLSALAASFPLATEIRIAGEDNLATVSAGRSRFRLACIPIDDLPPMPRLIDETGHVELAREEILALLRVGFAASTDPAKFYLNGLLLHDTSDGLAAASTDGCRLARVVIPGVSGLSQNFRLIIPTPSLKIIGKLLADDIERVTLRRSRTLFAVETRAVVLVSKLVDAQFPSYTALIPKLSGNSAIVDRAALALAVERAAVVVEPGQRRVVGVTWGGGEAVRVRLTEGGAADDVIDGEVTGCCAFAVQIKYMAEALDALDGKRVRLDSAGNMNPILISGPDDEADLLVLQMPHQWPAAQAAA